MNKDKLEVFMNYLKEQFPGCIEDHFTYDLIKNLIDYVYSFAFRGAEKRPITKEKALSIIDDSGNYLDITETDNEILLNTFSSNDMW